MTEPKTDKEEIGSHGDQTESRETADAGQEPHSRREAAPHREGPGHQERPANGSDTDCSRSEGTAEKEQLESDWYQLGFSISRSLRYHAKRRAFFERCNHMARVLLAITGAGAVVTLLNQHPNNTLVVALGIAIAVMTSLDLAFDFSRRAMDYDTLYKRFADLAIKVASMDRTRANCRLVTVEQLIIEKEEPSILRVLDVLCSNEERQARDFPGFYKVSGLQRFFSPVLDWFPPPRFELLKQPDSTTI